MKVLCDLGQAIAESFDVGAGQVIEGEPADRFEMYWRDFDQQVVSGIGEDDIDRAPILGTRLSLDEPPSRQPIDALRQPGAAGEDHLGERSDAQRASVLLTQQVQYLVVLERQIGCGSKVTTEGIEQSGTDLEQRPPRTLLIIVEPRSFGGFVTRGGHGLTLGLHELHFELDRDLVADHHLVHAERHVEVDAVVAARNRGGGRKPTMEALVHWEGLRCR